MLGLVYLFFKPSPPSWPLRDGTEKDTKPHSLLIDVTKKIPCIPEASPGIPQLHTATKSRVSDVFANILLLIAIIQIMSRERW